MSQASHESKLVQTAVELAREIGFESIGTTPASSLEARPEVRDMCGTCRVYNTNWSCPPACGSIEDFQELFKKFSTCVVFQTVGEIEDSFDIENMLAIEENHKRRVFRYLHKVSDAVEGSRVFSAGTCVLCNPCTYPDAPCKHPTKQMVSVEAAGLLVNDLCNLAGVPYNHGTNKLAYTSCVLVP